MKISDGTRELSKIWLAMLNTWVGIDEYLANHGVDTRNIGNENNVKKLVLSSEFEYATILLTVIASDDTYGRDYLTFTEIVKAFNRFAVSQEEEESMPEEKIHRYLWLRDREQDSVGSRIRVRLKILVSTGLLAVEKVGNAKHYSLTSFCDEYLSGAYKRQVEE